IHRSPAGMKANAELPRRGNGGLEEIPRSARENVMVVGGRRASRTDKGGQARARRRPLHIHIDVRPYRIQLGQPLEEIRLLRTPAREPLIEMMVAIDQPRCGQATAAVDAPDTRLERGCSSAAHLDDGVALDDDVTI